MSNLRINVCVIVWCGMGIAGSWWITDWPWEYAFELALPGWWLISLLAGLYFSGVIERGLKRFVEDTVDEVLRNRDRTN